MKEEFIELKAGSCIHIGSSKIAVLGVKGSQVKIGVEAPKQVEIVRSELVIDDLSYLDEKVAQFKCYRI